MPQSTLRKKKKRYENISKKYPAALRMMRRARLFISIPTTQELRRACEIEENGVPLYPHKDIGKPKLIGKIYIKARSKAARKSREADMMRPVEDSVYHRVRGTC